ncbi:MAG: MBL fold metallo-hydrolase [Candidatus Latescibacteria bacterium]|nr:MBL fold metallo-hydrolase [Candidatus Latescibacterota bacterium]
MHPFEDLVVPAGSVGIHWFGQSSYGLKNDAGAIALVDPYFPQDRPPSRFVHLRSPLWEESLRTDLVLLTHDHSDHTWPESLRRIWAASPAVSFVGPVESEQRVRREGMGTVGFTVVQAGGQVQFGGLQIHAVWAKPPGGLPQDKIEPPDVTHLGYVVDTGAVRVYISGDPVHTFGDHESLLGPVRALRPHIGLLTCQPGEGEFPSFAGSAKVAVQLGLKTAVPAHYSCFVSRNYDPQEWAAHLPPKGPKPLIMAYNQSVVYTP